MAFRLYYLENGSGAFILFTPVAAKVDFINARIVLKWSTSKSNRAVGPIRNTMKSSVASTGIGKQSGNGNGK